MIIKICGLTRPQDVQSAIHYGADALGMISGVSRSPRNNDIASLEAMCNVAPMSQVAFLRQNGKLEETCELLERFKPGILHLCGQEDQDYRQACRQVHETQVWQTIGIPLDQDDDTTWFEKVQEAKEDSSIDRIVLDSAKGGQAGGVGQSFPFAKVIEQLGKLSEGVIFAGGLNEANLEELFSFMTPFGIDASSGVEASRGIKSDEKIKLFVNKARSLANAC